MQSQQIRCDFRDHQHNRFVIWEQHCRCQETLQCVLKCVNKKAKLLICFQSAVVFGRSLGFYGVFGVKNSLTNKAAITKLISLHSEPQLKVEIHVLMDLAIRFLLE